MSQEMDGIIQRMTQRRKTLESARKWLIGIATAILGYVLITSFAWWVALIGTLVGFVVFMNVIGFLMLPAYAKLGADSHKDFRSWAGEDE